MLEQKKKIYQNIYRHHCHKNVSTLILYIVSHKSFYNSRGVAGLPPQDYFLLIYIGFLICFETKIHSTFLLIHRLCERTSKNSLRHVDVFNDGGPKFKDCRNTGSHHYGVLLVYVHQSVLCGRVYCCIIYAWTAFNNYLTSYHFICSFSFNIAHFKCYTFLYLLSVLFCLLTCAILLWLKISMYGNTFPDFFQLKLII